MSKSSKVYVCKVKVFRERFLIIEKYSPETKELQKLTTIIITKRTLKRLLKEYDNPRSI